jgi:hypothetical protein
MRIISQGGKIDLPYEQISISIDCDDERTIIAYAVSSGTIWELAEYSKKEKAEKAMEMLRTEYGNYKQAKSSEYYFAFNYPKVFRFPQDSGV